MTVADALGRHCRPLINVCDRYDMVNELTRYLYSNNMLRYIEGYAQKVRSACCPPAAALWTWISTIGGLAQGQTFPKKDKVKVPVLLHWDWRQQCLLCGYDDNACWLTRQCR